MLSYIQDIKSVRFALLGYLYNKDKGTNLNYEGLRYGVFSPITDLLICPAQENGRKIFKSLNLPIQHCRADIISSPSQSQFTTVTSPSIINEGEGLNYKLCTGNHQWK
ncbi:hypothetical protein ACSVDA_04730 [Cytobacillus sp. Hm23]